MFTSDPSNMMQKIMQMGAAGGAPSREAMMSAIDPTDIQGRMAKLFAGAGGDQSSVMQQIAEHAAPSAPPGAPVTQTFAQPDAPQQPAPAVPQRDPWSVQFEAMDHNPFGTAAQSRTGMY